MNRRTWFSILGLVFLLLIGQGLALGDEIPPPPDVIPGPVPTDTPVPFHYQVPPELSDGWPVGDIRKQKGDLKKVTEGIEGLQANPLAVLNSLLIFRHGKLVLENYFNGFDPKATHPLFSCTKSVFSTVYGIAQDQGLLDVNQKLYDLYPGQQSKAGWDARKADITLGNLLSMTTGLDCNDVGTGDANCGVVMARSSDWLDFCFRLPMAHMPGETWTYNGCCLSLLSNLIAQKSGMSFPEFARKVLLEPLEIPQDSWPTGPNGVNRVDYGLEWKPRDMGKLGQLYLDKGLWKGKRIVSEAWVKDAISLHAPVGQAFGHDYGYLWHLKTMAFQGKAVRVFYANGYRGQAIFVSPEADLVCVMTADSDDGSIYSKEERFFERDVLGAFK